MTDTILTRTRTIGSWIDGQVVAEGTPLEVRNPASDETVAEVYMADLATTGRAIASSAKAFETWSQTTLNQRARILFAFRQLVQENADELAAQISTEHGKTIDDARGEVLRALDSVELAIGGPGLLKGQTSEQTGPNIDTSSHLQPLGVCVGITPFNFPLMMAMMMAPFALACGNTFIWKPSEQDPGVSVRIAELFKQAGLPDGVFTVIHGGQDVSEALIDAPETQAISFVGSSRVAHEVYKRAAQAGTRCQAFGGAKNHLVVMPDADLDLVADQLTSAAFGAAGQRCMAVSVAVVVGQSPDTLLGKVAQRAREVVVGAGDQPGTEVGPLVNRASQERVREALRKGVAEGARLVVDRSEEAVAGYESGYFVGPTIVTDISRDSALYREELFAPVLTVLSAATLEEALGFIAEHPYGNGASIFTQSGAAAHDFKRKVSAGMVGVNVAIPVPVAQYAVQGWKSSAFGDTGLNNQSWSFWSHAKYVTERWDSVAGQDFGFRPN